MTLTKITFHNHPLKVDIIARWENGESSQGVLDWLTAEHPDMLLSHATLCKHHRNYKNKLETIEPLTLERPGEKQLSQIETILWNTIQECATLKQSKSLGPKEWQYIDQQQQNALEKIIRIQEKSGDTRDISVILSEIFTKMEAGEDVDVGSIVHREISEEEKLQVVSEVDKENEDK